MASAAKNTGSLVVIILGVILLIIGFVAGIPVLWTIGIILVVIGAVLALLGVAGREIGGRRYWY
jgi:cell division protein FtsW (lipid II flippase)